MSSYEVLEILLFEARDGSPSYLALQGLDETREAAHGPNQRRGADDEDDPHGSKA